MIYLDNMAGTMPDKRVIDEMLPWVTERFGNPSAHFYPLGREAYLAMEKARGQVAAMLNAPKPENIVFTSNGTESNNLAIKGFLEGVGNAGKRHVIISEIEHFSVTNPLIKMVPYGYELTQLKVNTDGLIDLDDLKRALRKDTAMVSINYANPEIGSVQNVKEIGRVCKESGVLFHTDAVAAAGRLPINVQDISADMVSISSQNFYGPRGAAALYVADGVILKPLLDGGFQERGRRGGSENIPGIVGMGKAAEIAAAEMNSYVPHMNELSANLQNGLVKMFDYLHITGSRTNRLPGHVSFWLEYVEGESVLMWYALNNIYVASGSACSSNILAKDEEDLVASHVLTAVGVPSDICAGSITMSLSKYTTKEEIDKVLEVTPEIVQKLAAMSPAYNRK